MKELIFLFFGNTSNFIASHFWNLNDEILKKDTTNNLYINQNIIYDDNVHPRCLLFDFSENIRPYFQTNDKLTDKEIEAIKEEVANEEDNNIQLYNYNQKESNFISMMNQLSNESDDEYGSNILNKNIYDSLPSVNDKVKTTYNPEPEPGNANDTLISTSKVNMTLDEILKLPDDKLYDYLDFENNVNNWNDFLQPKFTYSTLNEIKTVDVDMQMRSSYIHGKGFLLNYPSYFELFEDNFRKQLENCDKLEVLNLNVDHNSFWGGLSLHFMEDIHEMIPKTLKVYNAIDYNSSFYNLSNNDFNVEKFTNFTFLFSDLYDTEGSNILINPIYLYQTPSFVKKVFNYKLNDYNKPDPVYNFYFSSLASLQLQTLYMPLRSNSYGKSIYLQNLLLHNSHLNIFESDLAFNLNEVYNSEQTNGYLMNMSRNFNSINFSWKKLINLSYALNAHNSSIIYGYDESYKFIGEKYNEQLAKMSKLIFSNEDTYELPICAPRKYFDNDNKPYYIKNMSLLENNRPFIDFCLSYLKNYKNEYKDFNSSISKYLSHIDNEKYYDYKDKAENIFNMIYTYKDFAENILNIYDDSESEENDD